MGKLFDFQTKEDKQHCVIWRDNGGEGTLLDL
jgi:hypothetical protein